MELGLNLDSCIPSDPLISLPVLPKHPPGFVPSEKFTEERREKIKINLSGFLWPEEEKLVLFLIKAQEEAIAWDPTEHGNFRKDYFKPIIIPTVPHMPWVKHNIPILPGIYNKVVRIIKENKKIGIYERSNSSYQSKWFCVLKKDGKSQCSPHPGFLCRESGRLRVLYRARPLCHF